MRKIRVFQGDCYLSLDYQEQSGQIHWREGMKIKRAEVKVEKDESLKLELAAFVARGEAPAVTGQQGRCRSRIHPPDFPGQTEEAGPPLLCKVADTSRGCSNGPRLKAADISAIQSQFSLVAGLVRDKIDLLWKSPAKLAGD